jgi:hypothetical protein
MAEHAALITVLIVDRPMCALCLADKTSLSTAAVKRYLGIIRKTLAVRPSEDRCRSCGEHREVFSLTPPQGACAIPSIVGVRHHPEPTL